MLHALDTPHGIECIVAVVVVDLFTIANSCKLCPLKYILFFSAMQIKGAA